MRMTQLRPTRQALNLVNARKCLTAIPAKTALHRDVLIQNILDPFVRSIEFLKDVRFGGNALTVNSIVVRRDDGAFMLDIAGYVSPLDVDQEEILHFGLMSLGISLLRLDAGDVRCEPKLSNAREVWSHRTFDVYPGDRSEIISALSEFGPRPIGALDDMLPLRRDATSSVYAMCCEDLVEIDITTHSLGPHTVVRARR